MIILIAIAVLSPIIGCLMDWWYIGKLEEKILQERKWADSWYAECMDLASRYYQKQPRGKNGRFVRIMTPAGYEVGGGVE